MIAASVMPEVIELTPDAVATCCRWAQVRGVTTEAMISGCMVAHLLHGSNCVGGVTQVGSLTVSLEGIALRIRTVEEFVALLPRMNVISASPDFGQIVGE